MSVGVIRMGVVGDQCVAFQPARGAAAERDVELTAVAVKTQSIAWCSRSTKPGHADGGSGRSVHRSCQGNARSGAARFLLPRGCHDAPEFGFPPRNAAGARGTTEQVRASRTASTIDASPRRATVVVEAARKGSNPAGVAVLE